jgi:DNA/RNA endonuclease YhcR with UshA esterase domain
LKKILAFLATTYLLQANFEVGETKETETQGVHELFKNTTTVKFENIQNCDSKEIKSTVFTSKINNTPIKTDRKTLYAKKGVESGVKICLDEDGNLKIHSYKNKLFIKKK